MIVFSDAILAAHVAAADPDYPLFLSDDRVTLTNVVADDELAGFPASNLWDPTTISLWKAGTTDPTSITVTLNSAEPLDAVAFARHNFGTAQCGVAIFGKSAEPGAVFEELIAEQIFPDDAPVILVFDELSLAAVRIDFTPDAVAPQAAHLRIGKTLQMPKGLQPGHVPLPLGRSKTRTQGIAMSGDYLGSISLSQSLASSINFKSLDADWYRSTMQPFIDVCTDPFFYAWRPFSYPREAGYAWATSPPQPTASYFNPALFDLSMSLQGLAL